MFSLLKTFLLIAIFAAGALVALGQTDASSPFPDRDKGREDENKVIKELLTKQQAERDKKEHAAMLKRGEEALAISDQLEKAFETSNHLSLQDEKKLVNLEKLVLKIRDELGGDDDSGDEEKDPAEKPSTVKEAFGFLRSSTVKLVDELKKTTRFSISAVAIQTSNTVIKIVRFLRLRN